jgi:hypothetical protein
MTYARGNNKALSAAERTNASLDLHVLLLSAQRRKKQDRLAVPI